MKCGSAIALLGWGVLSLGSSRPWGYVPLIAAMATYGLAFIGTRRPTDPVGRALSLSLAAVCVTILIQLVPLPAYLVRTISPAATAIASRVPRQAGHDSPLPLSVEPRETLIGLTFVSTLALFFVGAARSLGRSDVRTIAAGLVVLGAIVAAIGVAEQSTSWPGVYDSLALPLPPDSTPLGPFASRNHYAGWVLMTFAVTLGYLCAIVDRGFRPAPAGTQHEGRMVRCARAVWAVVVTFAVAVMAVALIQARSRAGIVGLAVALTIIGGRLIRRIASPKPRIAIAAALCLLPVLGIAVTGAQLLVNRFITRSWGTAHGRLPIWQQAIAIASDFPITGSGLNTYQRVVRFYPLAGRNEPYEGAHNDFLQLTMEGGLLVGVPAVASTAFFVRQARQRFRDSSDDQTTRWIRIGAVTGLLLVTGQEMVDFSLQIPGNAALFAVLAAIAIHRSDINAYAQ